MNRRDGEKLHSWDGEQRAIDKIEGAIFDSRLRFTSTRDSREDAVNLLHARFTRDSRAIYIR